MRAIVILVLSSALLAGCKHARPSDSAAAAGKTPPKARTDSASTKATPARDGKTPPSRPAAINEPAGKVASVNPALRFVVIDFAFNPPPQVDQRLAVYRDGQKVGEIKISSQARNNIIAADITAGEARIGDEVRPQ